MVNNSPFHRKITKYRIFTKILGYSPLFSLIYLKEGYLPKHRKVTTIHVILPQFRILTNTAGIYLIIVNLPRSRIFTKTS